MPRSEKRCENANGQLLARGRINDERRAVVLPMRHRAPRPELCHESTKPIPPPRTTRSDLILSSFKMLLADDLSVHERQSSVGSARSR